MLKEILGNCKSWDREDCLLPHQAHRLVTQLIGVVDGGHTGLGGVECAGLSGGMDRNSSTGSGSLVHCCCELGLGVLIGSREFAIANRVLASLVNLDEVRSFLHLLADHFSQLIGAVCVRGVRKHVLRGIVLINITATTENVDGVAADPQTRSGNKSLIDRVPDCRVCGTSALGAHVALR